MDIKKKTLIEAYRKSFGNISVACRSIGIDRSTHYRWLKEDEQFAKAIEEIEPDEDLVDFAENALQKKIQDGDTTAIIFTLKTKGKKRGYVERVENVEIEQPSIVEINPIDERSDIA